jgi:hypothetical protein
MSAMSKAEREDLQRLIRQREKVQKSAAKQRSTELLADFQNQIAAQYSSTMTRSGLKSRRKPSAKSQKRKSASPSAARNSAFRKTLPRTSI